MNKLPTSLTRAEIESIVGYEPNNGQCAQLTLERASMWAAYWAIASTAWDRPLALLEAALSIVKQRLDVDGDRKRAVTCIDALDLAKILLQRGGHDEDKSGLVMADIIAERLAQKHNYARLPASELIKREL